MWQWWSSLNGNSFLAFGDFHKDVNQSMAFLELMVIFTCESKTESLTYIPNYKGSGSIKTKQKTVEHFKVYEGSLNFV